MWKPQAHSQAPCVGFEVKGPVGEKVQGHTTVQLQFSRKSPVICQRVCVEAMRHLHVVSYSSVTPIFCVSRGHFLSPHETHTKRHSLRPPLEAELVGISRDSMP